MHVARPLLPGHPGTPNRLFMAQSHRAVAKALEHGLQQPGLVAALTGEPGLGKSVLLRHVLAGLPGIGPVRIEKGRAADLRGAWDDLLTRAPVFEHHPTTRGQPSDKDARHNKSLAHGRGVLVVEDAHELSVPQLEEIGWLVAGSAPRPHVVFVAWPRFWPALSEPALAGLRDAITVRAVLFPMIYADSERYIEQLFRLAGGDVRSVMSDAELHALVLATSGNPRRINLELSRMRADVTRQSRPRRRSARPMRWAGVLAGLTAAAAIAGAGIELFALDPTPPPALAPSHTVPQQPLPPIEATAPAPAVPAPGPGSASAASAEPTPPQAPQTMPAPAPEPALRSVPVDPPEVAPASVPAPPALEPTSRPGSAEVAPTDALPAAPSPVQFSTLSPALVAALLRRGDEMLAMRDVSAARLLYERAALSGSARAALSLGATYDPGLGGTADGNAAVDWYRIAASLGDAEAQARLQRLTATEMPR